MNIAICDDDKAFAQCLMQMLTQYPGFDRSWKIKFFSTGNELIFEYLGNNHPFDIVFLDMKLPTYDGIRTGELIRENDDLAIIIVVTKYSDRYSLKAYSIYPLHYLPKPIDQTKLHEVLDRALKNVARTKEQNLFYRENGELRTIPIDAIYYIESDDHYITIFSKGKPIRVKRTLSSVLNNLDRQIYMQVNQRCIVNLLWVTKYDLDTKIIDMKNGATIKVSRPNNTKFQQKYSQIHAYTL